MLLESSFATALKSFQEFLLRDLLFHIRVLVGSNLACLVGMIEFIQAGVHGQKVPTAIDQGLNESSGSSQSCMRGSK